MGKSTQGLRAHIHLGFPVGLELVLEEDKNLAPARVPTSRETKVFILDVFPVGACGKAESLLQANITIDHRSQITDHRRSQKIENAWLGTS